MSVDLPFFKYAVVLAIKRLLYDVASAIGDGPLHDQLKTIVTRLSWQN